MLRDTITRRMDLKSATVKAYEDAKVRLRAKRVEAEAAMERKVRERIAAQERERTQKRVKLLEGLSAEVMHSNYPAPKEPCRLASSENETRWKCGSIYVVRSRSSNKSKNERWLSSEGGPPHLVVTLPLERPLPEQTSGST